MAFRYDLFEMAMSREAARIREAEQLSLEEQLVFSRMLDLVSHFVIAARPYPVASEDHLPGEILERMRQNLSAMIEWRKQQACRRHAAFVDCILAYRTKESSSGTVVPFPKR